VSVALALKKLPNELKSVFESESHEDYKWGTIHNQYYKIVPWGELPLLNKIWQRNHPVGGNSRTLNVAIQTHQSKSYNSIASPAFRFISDINKTYYSLEVGESDRILSPFYDNFVGQNRYVEYIPRNPYE
jgi:acyl-homoserine lactone acylase PvdQ